jgi:hypothetical protein
MADTPNITPAPPTPGTFCATHPMATAAGTCAHCGNFGCGDCLGRMEGRLVCRTCVEQGRVQVGLSPFDRRGELGLLSAFWATLVGVCLRPGEFFAELAPTGRLGGAFGFLLLVSLPAYTLNSIYNFLLRFAVAPSLEPVVRQVYDPISPDLADQLVASLQPSMLDLIGGIVLGPAILTIMAIVTGLVMHLGLLLVGGAARGIEASLKVSLYGHGVAFWLVVPLLGGLCWLWLPVILGFGLARIHGVPGWKAAVAVLWGPVLGCCCGFLTAFGLVAWLGSAL